ncbi:hypothetical protein, unlikely [Trypanosoma brucei gambiense DAL972]|uniref:Uncharacterized protein n=1 Tax=Trypanosoma brucei gambiense (strain MHOM/CI/86/DAL972) TaxID=679716 RepID=C9ZUQ8_TRYB9|nr:hypothetical protein, unlikely [Trypanosoma brucei gambiense DAL972]CBH13146.1 hypothetical protein, unlikely [Trypanosoma brucei gambiense DAL972]|eukprot:XP_011775423.1 hypothetical protein, unlikely [Trypanosoma brucei gambiense DAL972]
MGSTKWMRSHWLNIIRHSGALAFRAPRTVTIWESWFPQVCFCRPPSVGEALNSRGATAACTTSSCTSHNVPVSNVSGFTLKTFVGWGVAVDGKKFPPAKKVFGRCLIVRWC